ncbi:MAG: HK97 gp10 family phage protein [Sarcina sp.]
MDEVSINLGRVISDLLPQTIEKGLELCGQLIENEAKKNCPVDTGILRASLNHAVEGDKVIIGTNVEYAPIVYEKHGSKSKYLQRAVDENMQECTQVFHKLLEKQGGL